MDKLFVLMPLVIMLGFTYLLLVLPVKRQQARTRRMLNAIEVGSVVVTAGGLVGTVRDASSDDLAVELAPGVVVTVVRRGVAAVRPTSVAEPEPAVWAPSGEALSREQLLGGATSVPPTAGGASDLPREGDSA